MSRLQAVNPAKALSIKAHLKVFVTIFLLVVYYYCFFGFYLCAFGSLALALSVSVTKQATRP
jgi:hypothetical protein